jgi:membrane fusion protein (multidrug efflux system)
MEDGSVYPHTGKLLFSDMSVDESSGAITLRAEVPNPDRVLLPGMYVRARLEQAVNEDAITVPQQAVMRSPNGAAVYVVGQDGKVAAQPVKTGSVQGNQWVITDGLKTGDKVIVEGLQKVKPGAPVKAVPWQQAGGNATPQNPPADNAAADKKTQ